MHRLISRAAPGTLPGLPPVIAQLLLARGVDSPQAAQAFLHPDESMLHDPLRMQNMQVACDLIRGAVRQGHSIVVYGDYDCDGVCASVIAQEALQTLGAQAEVYIPSRKEEGYGLNAAAIEMLAQKHQLMITVDCGITAVEEVALAKSLGMRVIVTDHHTIPPTLPPADVVLHPQLGDYPCPHLCGAGVAYKLACALTGRQTLPSLPLCGLATIADMVPLLGENRVLAALGLQAMQTAQRPGLRALLSVAGIKSGDSVSGTQAAFQLAPRINACGRMDTARIALELLSTRDALRAVEMAEQADALNARRKNIEQRILEAADQQVRQSDLCAQRAIVVMGEGWESGVVGLVAGRLAERYGYPTVALSREGDVCVGSARSACGVDLYQALSACADLFTRFGGHKQAAGLTIPAERVPEFLPRLSAAVEQQLDGRTLMPETHYDAELKLSDISLELINQLAQLEPFGMGNPAPVFLLDAVDVVSARAVGAENAHLKLTLSQDGAMMDAIAFQIGARAGTLYGLCSLAVSPTANTFGGKTTAECRVEAIGRAQARFSSDESAEALAILQELSRFCRIETICPPDSLAFDWPAPTGDQGTLFLCRTAETAARVCAQYPQLDILQDVAVDPRAYNAVWLCDQAACRGPYRRLVLCDGLLCGQEAALLKALYPQAELIALPQSAALQGRLNSLRFSLDDLRALYVQLRGSRRAEDSQPRVAAMLAVLRRLHLISEQNQVLDAHKCDPTADLLYQLIQGSET